MHVVSSSEIGSSRSSLYSSVDWLDNQQLAVASADSKARLYTIDGKEITTFSCSAPVRKLRFSSQAILATSSMDGKVQLWDVRSSNTAAIGEITLAAPVRSMEWNNDTQSLALTDRARKLYVYDVKQKTPSPKLSVADMEAECAFWYQNHLVMGDDRGLLHVWDFQKSNEPIWRVAAHSGGIYTAYAHKDFWVTGGADATVLFWDTATMSCLQSSVFSTTSATSQPRRTKYISSIAGRGDSVAVAGPDLSIDIFQRTELVGTIPTKPLEEVAFNQSGQLLACIKVDPGPVTLHKLSFAS